VNELLPTAPATPFSEGIDPMSDDEQQIAEAIALAFETLSDRLSKELDVGMGLSNDLRERERTVRRWVLKFGLLFARSGAAGSQLQPCGDADGRLLEDSYLKRGRFEIGRNGAHARSLRDQFRLDSGCLTRAPNFRHCIGQRLQPRRGHQIRMRRDRTIRQLDLSSRFGAFFSGEGDAHNFDFSFSSQSLPRQATVQGRALIQREPLLWRIEPRS
jgi:hypothetical protein